MNLAEESVRLDPRSSFAFALLAYVQAMEGNYDAAMNAARKAVEPNPYDMGARAFLEYAISSSASTGRRSNCSQRLSSAATATPDSNGRLERLQPLFARTI